MEGSWRPYSRTLTVYPKSVTASRGAVGRLLVATGRARRVGIDTNVVFKDDG
jgi:hypothetical protein